MFAEPAELVKGRLEGFLDGDAGVEEGEAGAAEDEGEVGSDV